MLLLAVGGCGRAFNASQVRTSPRPGAVATGLALASPPRRYPVAGTCEELFQTERRGVCRRGHQKVRVGAPDEAVQSGPLEIEVLGGRWVKVVRGDGEPDSIDAHAKGRYLLLRYRATNRSLRRIEWAMFHYNGTRLRIGTEKVLAAGTATGQAPCTSEYLPFLEAGHTRVECAAYDVHDELEAGVVAAEARLEFAVFTGRQWEQRRHPISEDPELGVVRVPAIPLNP